MNFPSNLSSALRTGVGILLFPMIATFSIAQTLTINNTTDCELSIAVRVADYSCVSTLYPMLTNVPTGVSTYTDGNVQYWYEARVFVDGCATSSDPNTIVRDCGGLACISSCGPPFTSGSFVTSNVCCPANGQTFYVDMNVSGLDTELNIYP